MEQSQSYKYWFRKKYNLPPTDPRYLMMTQRDIVKEYWTDKFDGVAQKGHQPTIDYFDTDFVDNAIEKWDREDGDLYEFQRLKSDPDEWEEVE